MIHEWLSIEIGYFDLMVRLQDTRGELTETAMTIPLLLWQQDLFSWLELLIYQRELVQKFWNTNPIQWEGNREWDDEKMDNKNFWWFKIQAKSSSHLKLLSSKTSFFCGIIFNICCRGHLRAEINNTLIQNRDCVYFAQPANCVKTQFRFYNWNVYQPSH